ncbi:MAG TPA: type I 3-dehydroquinate dehydratase [Vicinamibacterales bacterium]|nr:type I 3-dehydroquinate dehydratase [Vicinamibacterales bacterium]
MANSRVCVAVTGRTMTEIRQTRDAVEGAGGADLVEMRLDTVDRPDVAGALAGRRGPVIVTCRAEWEGGHFKGSEEERRRILEDAIARGAEYVDVEARAAFAGELIRSRQGRGVILSSHIFGSMPLDLGERWRGLLGSGAEIVKLAVESRSLSDTLRLMMLAGPRPSESGSGAPGHVLIAMGDAGVASRVLATRIGNAWTYAGDNVAPGQVSLARLLNEFRFRDLKPQAAVYGVVGNPVMHSLSPVMHNAGFRCLGIDAVYLPLLAADAADVLTFARGLGLSGVSITAPFKVALMSAADELDPLAQRVGAINTLAMRDGQWLGYNTDVHGFAAPLLRRLEALPPKGGSHPSGIGVASGFSRKAAGGGELQGTNQLRASILGAGGAARAVAVALADLDADVTVCARRPEAARELADLAGGTVGTLPPAAGSWDLLVNSTSWDGDAAVNSPMAGAALDGKLVYELLYVPAETRLLADARAAGCTTIGGLEMLVAQAEKQFEIWTGQAPPAGLFQQAAGQMPV